MNKWDKYFLRICNEVASNSKCLSRKIGAILVRDNRILCTGYNGPPAGVPHCGERYLNDKNLREEIRKRNIDPPIISGEIVCPRRTLGLKSGEGLDWCIAGHAERNVLITAARFGIATNGAKLYMDCRTPCTPCLVEIINAGIEEIIITEEHYYDLMAEWVLKNSKLRWRVYDLE
jgi:dCMP deaminase